MSQASTLALIGGLLLAGFLAAILLVRRLRARRGSRLRSKLLALFAGLIGVELAALPALLAAFFGEALLGAAASAPARWLAILGYAALTLYVIARLFPWREVEAMAEEPNARLRDILARLREDDR